MLCVVPIRGFDSGLTRLTEVLDTRRRADLAERVADHVLGVACEVAEVIVVSGDPQVLRLASRRRVHTVADPGRGLGPAASAGIRLAGDGSWAVLHADLPYLTAAELAAGLSHDPRPLLAPTHDGGTSLIVGFGQGFRFAYGAGSFHRHLRAAPTARILIRPGLALDLDTPRDLKRLQQRHPTAIP